MIERFFAEITNKRIRRGVFRGVKELERAIYQFLAVHNADPKPFVWRKTADQIINKADRARHTLNTVKAGAK